LANPGDPGHQAAVQAAKARAAERIDHFSEVQQQVYALLTPAQQAKLPQVLAEVQKERAAHHPAGSPPPAP
jgi:Spy/CpxP family protein refolding chaperone